MCLCEGEGQRQEREKADRVVKMWKRGRFVCITALFLAVVYVSSGRSTQTRSLGEEGSEVKEKVKRKKRFLYVSACVCMHHNLPFIPSISLLQSGLNAGGGGEEKTKDRTKLEKVRA